MRCCLYQQDATGPSRPAPALSAIIGTGFLANSEGLALTNRHVVDAIDKLPAHPATGESTAGALLFLLDKNRQGCQLLSLQILVTSAIGTFSSSEEWYGQKVPDVGFVQLRVRENPFLELATEKLAIRPGMEVSTIGYPMGDTPLTIHQKVSQISPFIRRGIVSSVYPCPVANPHGFTIDIMQQGGSSGSPIFGPDNRRVVGMMYGGINDVREGICGPTRFLYTIPTNISLAEPAYIIAQALAEYLRQEPAPKGPVPTLKELTVGQPKFIDSTGVPWGILPPT
jgi:Trypsin-like peptidase domain